MKNVLGLFSLFISFPAFADLKCNDEFNNTIIANVVGNKLELILPNRTPISLNNQMNTLDGYTHFYTAQEKQTRPMAGSIMKKATMLMTYPNSDLAIILFEGDAYAVSCK